MKIIITLMVVFVALYLGLFVYKIFAKKKKKDNNGTLPDDRYPMW